MKALLIFLLLLPSLIWGDSFTDHFEKTFAKEKPIVGEPLPETSGYDLEGKVFPLSKTRGKVIVIVSGCFT